MEGEVADIYRADWTCGHKVNSPVDKGWADVESTIILKGELAQALKGLYDFSHILVIFWMYQAKVPTVLQRQPSAGVMFKAT